MRILVNSLFTLITLYCIIVWSTCVNLSVWSVHENLFFGKQYGGAELGDSASSPRSASNFLCILDHAIISCEYVFSSVKKGRLDHP